MPSITLLPDSAAQEGCTALPACVTRSCAQGSVSLGVGIPVGVTILACSLLLSYVLARRSSTHALRVLPWVRRAALLGPSKLRHSVRAAPVSGFCLRSGAGRSCSCRLGDGSCSLLP